MPANNFKEARAWGEKIYSRKAIQSFWILWSCNVFGHLGIIMGLYIVNKVIPFFLFTSPIIFHYYLSGMQKLRRKRLFNLLVRNGYKEESAEEVLASNKRYALYLRGFNNEKSSMGDFGIARGIGEESETLGVKARPAYIEMMIAQLLNKDISLITLADAQNPVLMQGAKRFLKRPENWEELVHKLLVDADVVFLYITSFTPGINTEIEMLAKDGWLNKTIVIFEREVPTYLSYNKGNYKYVVYETGAMQWTRKHERKLQQNLKSRLVSFEANTYQQGRIVDASATKMSILSNWRVLLALKFFLPSISWFVISTIILIKIIYPSDIDEPSGLIARLGILFVVYFFVRVAKGMDISDYSDHFVKEDKFKTFWNNQTV